MQSIIHASLAQPNQHWRTHVSRLSIGVLIIAFSGIGSTVLAQSSPESMGAPGSNSQTSIAGQACQMYKDTLIENVRLTEQNLQAAMNSDRPDERITRRIAQEIRRDVLQGLIDVESDPGLKRILTRAANRFITTGHLDTYQQELQPFDRACPPVMAQRLSEPTPDAQASPSPQPRATRPNEPQRENANRLSLPESAPLRR